MVSPKDQISSFIWLISSLRFRPSLVCRMRTLESTSSLGIAWCCGENDSLDFWCTLFSLDGFFTCVRLGLPLWSILLDGMSNMPSMNRLLKCWNTWMEEDHFGRLSSRIYRRRRMTSSLNESTKCYGEKASSSPKYGVLEWRFYVRSIELSPMWMIINSMSN